MRTTLHFSFTVETGGAEWLAHDNADIQIDLWEETFAQGSTLARYVEVIYAADFNPETHELAVVEKLSASDY